MKEDMKRIFGKEWTWLRSFWFCWSLCLVGCVSCDAHPYVLVALLLNFMASAVSATRLPLDEYEG